MNYGKLERENFRLNRLRCFCCMGSGANELLICLNHFVLEVADLSHRNDCAGSTFCLSSFPNWEPSGCSKFTLSPQDRIIVNSIERSKITIFSCVLTGFIIFQQFSVVNRGLVAFFYVLKFLSEMLFFFCEIPLIFSFKCIAFFAIYW